jgi:hypothetical protein
LCNLYLSELGTKLIDDKREEEKVNVYEIKFQSTCIYKETNSKEIAAIISMYLITACEVNSELYFPKG